MKFIKKGSKYQLSKKAWIDIGKKAGWFKKSQSDPEFVAILEINGWQSILYLQKTGQSKYCWIDAQTSDVFGFGGGDADYFGNPESAIAAAESKYGDQFKLTSTPMAVMASSKRKAQFKPPQMAPGETPYTEKEYNRLTKMVGDAAREDMGEVDEEIAYREMRERERKTEEYKGFTIAVYPTAYKDFFYTEIDGVLIPNEYGSSPRHQGMGITNAIWAGKRAIDKAIMNNPHGADKNTILTYLGKWREFRGQSVEQKKKQYYRTYGITPDQAKVIEALEERGFNVQKDTVLNSWEVWKQGEDHTVAIYETFDELLANIDSPV